MLGTWKGELTLASGNVVEQYSEFYLVSGGNTIYERVIEDGVEMHSTAENSILCYQDQVGTISVLYKIPLFQ